MLNLERRLDEIVVLKRAADGLRIEVVVTNLDTLKPSATMGFGAPPDIIICRKELEDNGGFERPVTVKAPPQGRKCFCGLRHSSGWNFCANCGGYINRRTTALPGSF